MQTITKERLQQTLASRINESEAAIEALQAVTINTSHKTLTNRAIEGGAVRVDRLEYTGAPEALAQFLEQAGVAQLGIFGVESFANTWADYYNKNITMQQLQERLDHVSL